MTKPRDADSDAARARLLARRAELESLVEAGAEAAGTVELDPSRVGRLSRMDALQMQAMSQETERRRGVELQRIAAALARLDGGEYGYCVNCGEEIGQGRLAFDAAAPNCVACAGGAER